jgi:hypothetical protein
VGWGLGRLVGVFIPGYAADDRDEEEHDDDKEGDGDAGDVAAHDAVALCGVDRLLDIADVMHLVLHFGGDVVDHRAGRLLDVSGIGCCHESASAAVKIVGWKSRPDPFDARLIPRVDCGGGKVESGQLCTVPDAELSGLWGDPRMLLLISFYKKLREEDEVCIGC